MANLADLMDLRELEEAVRQKYVNRQRHPTLPYTIINYTHSCQFDRAWNDVTTQCRGLIVDQDGTLVSRPFSKFFNYGEHPEGTLDLSAPAEVTDKLDGSLGISYPTPDGWAVATRGSFVSPQARHATQTLRDKYSEFSPPHGVTILWEIIFRQNRIVLDYGDMDDLVLLGGIETATGKFIPAMDINWPGPRVTQFESSSLAEALKLPPRENAEGVVVRMLDSGIRVKIKQDDYKMLHRVLTGTTARTVWEFLAVNACKYLVGTKITKPQHWGSYVGIDGNRANEIIATGENWQERLLDGVPDEFHEWLRNTISDITGKVESIQHEAVTLANALRTKHGDDRKGFALEASKSPLAGYLFSLYLNREITTSLWEAVYPAHEKPFLEQGEDVA